MGVLSFDELRVEANNLVDQQLGDCTLTDPGTMGLDQRCPQLWVGPSYLVVQNCELQRLDYYGGFEYVAKENRMTIGDFTFFSLEDARVMEHWEQAEPFLCQDCNGSGEGMYDGTRCSTCHGLGTVSE